MNPDTEDPNNHVPEVSPGDNWDDLDQPEKKEPEGLPPRRRDAGLPPKKESRSSFVKRHTPVLKSDAPEEQDDETSAGNDETVPLKPEKKSFRKNEEQVAKKTVKEIAKKSPQKAAAPKEELAPAEPEPAVAETVAENTATEEETPIEEDYIGKVRLPPAQTGKRLRVHEIGIGESSATPHVQIVSKMIPRHPSPSSGESEEDIARSRRRFVRGERGDWGDEKGHGSFRWMAYTGIGVILLVVLTVFLSQKLGRKPDRESDKSQFSQLAPEEESGVETDEDPGMLEMLTNSQDKAKEIYARYATAKTPGELSGCLYHDAETMPLLTDRWQPLGAKAGWQPGDETLWTVMDRDGVRYGVLEGGDADFTGFTAVFRKDGESLKMDWKASSGYGTATFEEMNKGGGDGSEIRATISRAEFYTFSLPEEKYHSFRLMAPDGNSTLWVYTESGSETDGELLKLFIPSQITGDAQNEAQVTLSLTPGPGESLPNQWLISDLVRLSWLDK